MKSLKELYDDDFDVSVDVSEQKQLREKKYLEYKKQYIQDCKNERKNRYSFFQRHSAGIFIGLVLVFCFIVTDVIYLTNHLSQSDEPVSENNHIVTETKADFNDTETMSVKDDSLAGKNDNKKEPDTKKKKKDKKEDLKTEEIKVGSKVEFTGTIHYITSYANAEGSACSPGNAVVTKINLGEAHPYHIFSTDGNSTVYGWVNAEDIVVK